MKDQLASIYKPIQKDLHLMKKLLVSVTTESKNKNITKINTYILHASGKHLRPALMLLSARAADKGRGRLSEEKMIKLAAAVEMIHLASLVHDDVIDHAHIRHNQPSVNIKWGPEISIALGDYLYSTAFELIADCENIEVLRSLTCAIREISEGEFAQICERDNHHMMKRIYLDIIRKKTACLFSASSHVGAVIAEAGKTREKALENYGMQFGMAYQIIDDLIDLIGEKETLGKVPRQDLAVGELTLPLLHLLDSVSDREGEKIKKLILAKNIQETIVELKSMLEHSKSLEKTQESILGYIKDAQNSLVPLPESSYKESLLALTDLIYYARKV